MVPRPHNTTMVSMSVVVSSLRGLVCNLVAWKDLTGRFEVHAARDARAKKDEREELVTLIEELELSVLASADSALNAAQNSLKAEPAYMALREQLVDVKKLLVQYDTYTFAELAHASMTHRKCTVHGEGYINKSRVTINELKQISCAIQEKISDWKDTAEPPSTQETEWKKARLTRSVTKHFVSKRWPEKQFGDVLATHFGDVLADLVAFQASRT